MNRPKRRTATFALLVGLLITATAVSCGSDDDSSSTPAKADTTQAKSSDASTASTTAATDPVEDADPPPVDPEKPTVVLVHGAWADSSGWSAVTSELIGQGYEVIAPAIPLRGLPSDTEQLKSVLATIDKPIVLVGHSYGGMVTSNAATGNPNVKALVYVAAYAPEAGETAGGLTGHDPGSLVGPDTLVFRPYPDGQEASINPESFQEVFASDLDDDVVAAMATAQRPISVNALQEQATEPAWKTIPSWYVIATEDMTIPPATQAFMAERAGSTVVEVDSSHVAMITSPDEVTDVITEAATKSK